MVLRNHNGCLVWKKHIKDIQDGFEDQNKSSPFKLNNMANLKGEEGICEAGPYKCC